MPKLARWIANAMEEVLGSKMPLMQVVDCIYINSTLKKIRLHGDLSTLNFKLGYAIIIRVNDTEFRNYTASFADQQTGIIEIIFHLHGPGPGTDFLNGLEVGNQIRIGAPRGKNWYDSSIKQYLIFGDETTLGLATAFQTVLIENHHEFQFYFELEPDNQNAPELLELENYTVFEKNGNFLNEEWISNLKIFKDQYLEKACFILTGNVKSVQTFRRVLKSYHAKGKIYAQGYWLEGKMGL